MFILLTNFSHLLIVVPIPQKTALGFARTWHAVSAKDRTLGQLASRIAWVLQGKHKPFYDPAGTPFLPFPSSIPFSFFFQC
jgi:hypothetical protein